MSDYNKSTNFTTKDTLPTGNSQKLVKGTELDIEFTNIASAIASKANADNAALTGTPTTPTASLGTNTTQIASCAFALANGVPSGCILIWSGATTSIPTGWVLCNGSNGTPDLRDRFVIGAGSNYAVGATGGSKDAIVVSHTHTANTTNIDHTHYFSANTGGQSADHVHSSQGNGAPNGGGAGSAYTTGGNTPYQTTGTSNDHFHGISNDTQLMNYNQTHTHTINSAGVSGTNANMPPYYALAFIMKA
jgi:hypothetical protein